MVIKGLVKGDMQPLSHQKVKLRTYRQTVPAPGAGMAQVVVQTLNPELQSVRTYVSKWLLPLLSRRHMVFSVTSVSEWVNVKAL